VPRNPGRRRLLGRRRRPPAPPRGPRHRRSPRRTAPVRAASRGP